MPLFNTQDQIIELTDDQLELIEGGGFWGTLVDIGLGFVPIIGPMNTAARLTGGSIGQNFSCVTDL